MFMLLIEVARRIAERADGMYEDHSKGRRYDTAVRLFDSVDKLDKVASAATVANKDSDSKADINEK